MRRKLSKNKFRPWLLLQDEIWVDKTGKIHLVDQMDHDYIKNVILFTLRDSARVRRHLFRICGPGVVVEETPLMRRMLALTRPEND